MFWEGGGGGVLFGDSKHVRNRCCAYHALLRGSGGMPPPRKFSSERRVFKRQ